MLTVNRPKPPEALLTVAHWYSRLWPGWERFLIGWSALFHFWMSLTLALAPYEQLLSQGTQPVFDLASRYFWAVAFLTCGLACTALLKWRGYLMQVVTWMTLFPLGGCWLTAFILAVINDRGNAIGIVVWFILYGPWIVAAARLGLGKR